MTRFFRSALFPLIVISLLVFLASRTLMQDQEKQEKLTYFELLQDVRQGGEQFDGPLVITPNKHQITGKRDDGTAFKVNYPSDQSLLALERLMQSEGVNYDSKGTGSSP